MIPIIKNKAPNILASGAGAVATADLVNAYNGGQRQFKFKNHYKHVSVKKALFAAQHKKCAFCESFYLHVANGGIEHFRPKGGFIQSDGETLTQPGYYWLAYDWSNLFASCQLCNERFKKNWFPLANPAARARSHLDDLDREMPLLLRPDEPDLDRHLGYRSEVPFPVNGSERGKKTISILGLDRSELMEFRAGRLRIIVALAETVRILEAQPQLEPRLEARLSELRARLEESQSEKAEYSMMAKAAVKEVFGTTPV